MRRARANGENELSSPQDGSAASQKGSDSLQSPRALRQQCREHQRIPESRAATRTSTTAPYGMSWRKQICLGVMTNSISQPTNTGLLAWTQRCLGLCLRPAAFNEGNQQKKIGADSVVLRVHPTIMSRGALKTWIRYVCQHPSIDGNRERDQNYVPGEKMEISSKGRKRRQFI